MYCAEGMAPQPGTTRMGTSQGPLCMAPSPARRDAHEWSQDGLAHSLGDVSGAFDVLLEWRRQRGECLVEHSGVNLCSGCRDVDKRCHVYQRGNNHDGIVHDVHVNDESSRDDR